MADTLIAPMTRASSHEQEMALPQEGPYRLGAMDEMGADDAFVHSATALAPVKGDCRHDEAAKKLDNVSTYDSIRSCMRSESSGSLASLEDLCADIGEEGAQMLQMEDAALTYREDSLSPVIVQVLPSDVEFRSYPLRRIAKVFDFREHCDLDSLGDVPSTLKRSRRSHDFAEFCTLSSEEDDATVAS